MDKEYVGTAAKGVQLRHQYIKQQFQRVWVIGGGRFGKKAVLRLLHAHSEIDITVVEHNQEHCNWFGEFPVSCYQQDGVLFLKEHLFQKDVPDWIIPMVPFHLAFEWIKQILSSELHLVSLAVSDEIMKQFPNTSRGNTGRFYTSLADFLCPENCPALDHVCTVRQEPRPYFLYKKIETQNISSLNTIVIRSHQILPGIGGYRPDELYQALDNVRNSRKPILLSTACKCHGVIDLFKTCSYCKNNEDGV